MDKYGKIIVQGTIGSDLFETIKNAKEDFGKTNISEVTVSFNDSLMVPVKTLGVVVDFSKEIWDSIFVRESDENSKLTAQEINKKLAEYASQYALENDTISIENEDTTRKSL